MKNKIKDLEMNDNNKGDLSIKNKTKDLEMNDNNKGDLIMNTETKDLEMNDNNIFDLKNIDNLPNEEEPFIINIDLNLLKKDKDGKDIDLDKLDDVFLEKEILNQVLNQNNLSEFDELIVKEILNENYLNSNNDKQENSLVEVLNNEVVTTSLQVADFFGKRHKNVIKKIKQIIENMKKLAGFKSRPRDFYIETTYLDKQNKKRPMYIMNRDGFTKLAMGFTGQKADEFQWLYIEAFNQMEQQLKNQTKNQEKSFQVENPWKRTLLWLKENRKHKILEETQKTVVFIKNYIIDDKNKIISEQKETIAEQKPKVEFTEKSFGLSAIIYNKRNCYGL